MPAPAIISFALSSRISSRSLPRLQGPGFVLDEPTIAGAAWCPSSRGFSVVGRFPCSGYAPLGLPGRRQTARRFVWLADPVARPARCIALNASLPRGRLDDSAASVCTSWRARVEP